MLTSPLAKIPFILATTYSLTTAYTSSRATLAKHEQRPDVGVSSRFMEYMATKLPYLKVSIGKALPFAKLSRRRNRPGRLQCRSVC